MLADYKVLVTKVDVGIKHPTVIWVSPYGRNGTAVTLSCSEETYDGHFSDSEYGAFLRWKLNGHIDVMRDMDEEFANELCELIKSDRLNFNEHVKHSQRRYGEATIDHEEMAEIIMKQYSVSKPYRPISGAIIIK